MLQQCWSQNGCRSRAELVILTEDEAVEGRGRRRGTTPVRERETEGIRFCLYSHNSTPSFLHLSFCYSLSLMLSLFASLSPSSHPSPRSSPWQSIWPTQPCHPFNLSVLAMAPISHWLVFVARQAWPTVRAFMPSLKARGFNSPDSRVTESTPEWEGRRFSPHGAECSSFVKALLRNTTLLYLKYFWVLYSNLTVFFLQSGCFDIITVDVTNI